MTAITVSAYRWVVPSAQGLVRDLRVRWALEEAGLAYEERLLSLGDQKAERYLEIQPFGQVPTYEEDGLVLFESGAIVLHIAEGSEALLPADAAKRARATTWMFAALNTVEPPINAFNALSGPPADEAAKQRLAAAAEAVKGRLGALAKILDGQDYLEGRFTAGDLLMTTVLRMLRGTELVSQAPGLDAYLARCESRPAFQKALAAQMATFAENVPAAA